MFKMCSKIKVLVMKNTIFVGKIQILGCENTILGFSKLEGLPQGSTGSNINFNVKLSV